MYRPTLQLSDSALWRRLLLVALTGAVPLFIVSLTLIKTAYSELIEFSLQEQRGNRLQRPLERLLDLLPRYQAAAQRALGAGGATPAPAELAREIEQAFTLLGEDYRGELGRSLALDDGLARGGHDASRFSVMQGEWQRLAAAPLHEAASGQSVSRLVRSLRTMIRHVGDHSNLILDDDLDSFYLADITLSTLPETQERLSDVGLKVSDWLRTGQGSAKQSEIAVIAALLGRDLERIARDAQTSLREDPRFYGVSPSLQAKLPPAVARFSSSAWPLLSLLERAGAGDAVDPIQVQALAWQARSESFRLWDVSSVELEQLLQRRLDAIGAKRTLRYAIVVATLALAALGMGVVIRSLLRSRYEADEVFKQTAARFAQIFNHSPIPISVIRADGTVLDVNDSFLRLMGFELEEVVGRSTLELGLYPEPERRALLLEQVQREGHLHAVEQTIRTKSGEARQMLLWIDQVQIGGEACLLVPALDVTEQRKAEAQQRHLEEQLRQAQKLEALGTLAGGIAHDFNNILSGMVAFSEVTLAENPDNAELQSNLREVLKAGHRAADLVQQILSFSQQGKQDRQSQQLGPVVDEALTLLRATLPASIAIQRVVDGGLPNASVNSTQIHQIVMNLGTNAAHAMRGGAGRLRVELGRVQLTEAEASLQAELVAGDYLRLVFEDTGHGMDEATQRRIFEPFFTTKEAGEGTGLGLSVVHGIVKEHGGAIAVQSAPGRGTTISIHLPALAASPALETAAERELPHGAGQRVMFVDDEAPLRGVARKMLRRLGYEPVIFDTSDAVWVAFQKEPDAYAALVSDLSMPGLSGFDLARQILQLRPNFPIVLASGFGGKLTRTEARKLGIRELVSKPLDFRTLATALERALGADTVVGSNRAAS